MVVRVNNDSNKCSEGLHCLSVFCGQAATSTFYDFLVNCPLLVPLKRSCKLQLSSTTDVDRKVCLHLWLLLLCSTVFFLVSAHANYFYSCVFVGDDGVGKSTLLAQYTPSIVTPKTLSYYWDDTVVDTSDLMMS